MLLASPPRPRHHALAHFAVLAAIVLPLAAPAAAQDEKWWDAFVALNAPDARVQSMVEVNGTLAFAGQFLNVAGIPANRIAAWDGSSWSALGSGANGGIEAVATFGGNLVAVGNFSQMGGVPADRVAMWNGSTWSAFGPGPPGSNATCAIEFAGTLIVGESNGQVQQWNGSSWNQLGTYGDLTHLPRTFAVFGGEIYVGGDIGVRRWNGAAWQVVGGALTGGDVFALTVYAGKLIAAGSFTAPADNIAAWDGDAWSALGSGTNARILAATSIQTQLIVIGEFTQAGGSGASQIARWDGAVWSALGSGLNGVGRALHEYQGYLYAGGDFTQAGAKPSLYVARWTPTLDCNTNGVDDTIDISTGTSQDCNLNGLPDECDIAAGAPDCDSNGVPDTCQPDCDTDGIPDWCEIAAGAADCNANGIPDSCDTDCDGNGIADACDPDCDGDGTIDACEPNESWSGLGGVPPLDRRVQSMVVADSTLYATGQFPGRLASWNGTTWTSMGLPETVPIEAVARWHGLLVAVGAFDEIGGVPANGVAVRQGGTWSPLGAGVDGNPRSGVEFQGDLFVGTDGGIWRWNGGAWVATSGQGNPWSFFVWNGQLYSGATRWDGASWQPLASPAPNGRVLAMCEFQDRLILAGEFTTIGGITANGLAVWDGLSWSALGTGLVYDPPGPLPPEHGIATGLMAYQNRLVVSGLFDSVDGVAASGVAAWDGILWRSLGSGLSGGTSASGASPWGWCLAPYQGALYVGGNFYTAGGHGAPMFARWSGCTDCNDNGIDDRTEIEIGAALDLNGNGLPDSCDIASGGSTDCNSNAVPDEIEPDCDGDGIPNDCEPFGGGPDCNANAVSDSCDILSGVSFDCNQNDVPDECEPDCDGDGIPDVCETLADCNQNGTHDDCDLASGTSQDCDSNGVPDDCQPDCDNDGVPDVCESQTDCNLNGIADPCDIAAGAPDCDTNGVPDTCQRDSDRDGEIDACEILNGAPDCNQNGVPDESDIAPGSLAFQEVFHEQYPVNPSSVVAFDLDQDGRLDVVTTGGYGWGIRVLWNEGSGVFTPQNFLSGESFAEVAVGRIGPGTTQGLVLFGGPAGGMTVPPDAGRSPTAAAYFYTPAPIGGYGSSAAIVPRPDLHDDIAWASGQYLTVVPSNIALEPILEDYDQYGMGNFNAQAATAADVDRDGATDILVAGLSSPPSFCVFRKLGIGYAAPVFYEHGYNWPQSITTGDFNGDLYPDVAIGHYANTESLTVHLNLGNGTFGPPRRTPFLATSTYSHIRSLGVADINRDGHLDVVGVRTYSSFGNEYTGAGAVGFALGNGDGTFSFSTDDTLERPSIRDLALADFDGDGWMDLVTAGSVKVYEQTGNDVFVFLNRSTSPPTSSDNNHDGIPDECQGVGVANELPQQTRFLGPDRNPARGDVRLRFTLAKPERAELTIHDVSGRLVHRWSTGLLPAGEHAILWSGLDHGGREVPGGVYFLKFTVGGRTDRVKLVRMR